LASLASHGWQRAPQGHHFFLSQGAQDSQRSKDQLVTAAAIVVFWPAAFFVGGDKQTAAELANMKGQMVAIEHASIAKKCNIQFQGKPPGA